MASKKQKKRREKDRRHEYEYVYVDAEGNEVPVEADDVASGSTNGKAQVEKAITTRGGRTVDPPSWRRTLRRAAIFAPLMAVVLYIMPGDNKTPATVIASTAMLMAFFIPFSYFMDGLMYRLAIRRGAKTSAPAKGSPRK